jgi:hypothetical protein
MAPRPKTDFLLAGLEAGSQDALASLRTGQTVHLEASAPASVVLCFASADDRRLLGIVPADVVPQLPALQGAVATVRSIKSGKRDGPDGAAFVQQLQLRVEAAEPGGQQQGKSVKLGQVGVLHGAGRRAWATPRSHLVPR